MTLPAPILVPMRCIRLGGRWSPRARRFDNGVVARVPRKLAEQWDRDHQRAQYEADLSYFKAEAVAAGKDITDTMNVLSIFFQAQYCRLWEMMRCGHSLHVALGLNL